MENGAKTVSKNNRNEEIYILRKEGKPFSAIAAQYGISSSRVTQIYEAERCKHECLSAPLPMVPSCKEETALYRLILNHHIEGFDDDKRAARLLYGAILKVWQHPSPDCFRKDFPPVDFIHDIKIEEDGTCRVRSIGKNACRLLADIQNCLLNQSR